MGESVGGGEGDGGGGEGDGGGLGGGEGGGGEGDGGGGEGDGGGGEGGGLKTTRVKISVPGVITSTPSRKSSSLAIFAPPE